MQEQEGKQEIVNTLRLEYRHPRTIHEQITLDIELKIISGDIGAGDKIPSIAEIAKQYNVSKSTAQRAIEQMMGEGLLSNENGVGYFVKHGMIEKLREKHKKSLENELEKCLSIARGLDIDLQDYLQDKLNGVK